MFKKILFILILPFFLYAQWTDPRPKSIQLWHLNTSFFDSLGNVVRDSVAALSADGVTIINDGAFKQRVFSSTTELSSVAADTNGSMVVVKGTDGGQFRWFSSGYTEDSVTTWNGSSGYFVRDEWLKNKIVYATWAGAVDDNSTDNSAAIQKAIDVPGIKGLHFPRTNTTSIYLTSNGFTISTSEFELSGETGVQLKLTGNDTLLYVTSNNTFRIDNIRLVGPGKATNTCGLYTYTPSGGGRHLIDNVWIEEFGTGYKNHEITQVTTNNMQVWDCNIGMAIGRQGDVHSHINYRAADCDTGVVVGWDRNTLGNAPVVFINAFFIRDSLNYMLHDRNHNVTTIGYYSENSKQEGLIKANSGNNLFYIQGGHTQESDSGWVVEGGSFGMKYMRGDAGSTMDRYVTISSGNLHTEGNIISGNSNIVYSNSWIFPTASNVDIGSENDWIMDLNASKYSSEYAISNEFRNGNGKYLQRWSRVSSAGARLWDIIMRDAGTGASNAALLGVSSGYIQFGTNTTSDPVAAAAENRGWIFNKDGTEASPDDPDSLLISIYSGSDYEWYDLIRGVYRGQGATAGTNSFNGSATSDTIRIPGVGANSVFTLEILDATPVADDLLSYTTAVDTLVVHRVAGTTSDLSYSWIWKVIK